MSTEALDKPYVVDADSHWTEWADLFTRSAPPEYRDRVPRVEEVGGRKTWVFDGHALNRFNAGGVVGRDGQKSTDAGTALSTWEFDDAHVGSWDTGARLQMMDEFGIDAQVIFPNNVGLGGQDLALVDDPALSMVTIQIYNDEMARIQAESDNRLVPLPLMPAWDIDLCVAEAQRVTDLGARGLNMTSDTQDLGAPDLADPAWDPLWELASELALPIHFHIGASHTSMGFFGKYAWPSHAPNIQLAIQGTMMFLSNARVVVNLLASGMFDRYPKLKMVSVESGTGWIPFILETLDYEARENAPEELLELERMPSEYFATNLYATWWFENHRQQLADLLESLGVDHIMFATDFPHPTCLYPTPLEAAAPNLRLLSTEAQHKVLGENARRLYRL